MYARCPEGCMTSDQSYIFLFAKDPAHVPNITPDHQCSNYCSLSGVRRKLFVSPTRKVQLQV